MFIPHNMQQIGYSYISKYLGWVLLQGLGVMGHVVFPLVQEIDKNTGINVPCMLEERIKNECRRMCTT